MIDKIEQETDRERERERERESPRYKQGKYADIHMICTYEYVHTGSDIGVSLLLQH